MANTGMTDTGMTDRAVDSAANRAARRSKAVRRAQRAAISGAAAAAMTVGLAAAPGLAPQAHAIDVTWNPTYTAGVLAGVLDKFGPESITLPIDGVGNLTLDLDNIPLNTPSLYNTIAAIPQQGTQTGGCKAGLFSSKFAETCRYALGLTTDIAVLNMVDAIRAQIQSVTTGLTPAGLIPFEPAPNASAQYPSVTSEVIGFVQNPLRPNGGLAARFPKLSNAIGINPVMPSAGRYTSAAVDGGKTVLNLSTLDVTWAYDPLADFPEVFNVLSLINSGFAGLPVNLVSGGVKLVIADQNGNPATTTALGLSLASVLQLGPASLLGPPETGKAWYITAVPEALPILTPVRLPGLVTNIALNALNSPYLLGNPLADILEPSLKILVNIGYDDVLPPDVLNDCATGCGQGGTPKTWAELGYTAYDRSFLKASNQTPFGSVDPLTPEQKKAVPGDAWRAFTGAVKTELAKPFWGIIVPANVQEAAVVNPAAVAKAAAANVVQAVDPAGTPKIDPADTPKVEASAPAQVSADPTASPAPVGHRTARSRAATGAPAGRSHRGASSDSGTPKSATSSGRHRVAG